MYICRKAIYQLRNMKSGRYVKVAENMPNYLSDISWEWEDRSQKSTGKEKRKRAPEKCKVTSTNYKILRSRYRKR